MYKKISLIVIFVVVLILYYPALNTYFSQADSCHFKISQTNNPFGFYPFTQRGVAFYRPISRELLFNLFYLIFGLNPIPFRILSFAIHFLNIYLVYLFARYLFKSYSLTFFIAFFFGITAAHTATLYYLAGGIQTLLATTFSLSSLLSFIKFKELKEKRFIVLSFILFLLGVASHEQAVITPILMLGVIWISKPQQLKQYFINLLPFFLTIFVLIYLEIFKIGFSVNESQYHAVFNIKTTLNSLFWYSNWALGLPETLIDFVRSGFKLNPDLLKYWGNYYSWIFPSYFISLLLIIPAAIYLLIKKILLNKSFLFCLIWFPLGLLPVILLPLHKSTHYLEISLPAFWAIIGYTVLSFYQELKKKKLLLSKIYIVTLTYSLIILSTVSAILGSNNYWAASRGKIANKLITDTKTIFPTLPKGAIIYFQNDPSYPHLTKEWGNSSAQANIILNGNDALQLLYKDPTLKVYYEDVDEIPKTTPDKNIYRTVARIY